MILGNELRKARLSQNISQQRLSDLTGISVRSISAYEQSKKVPKMERIIRISEALNVPVETFLRSLSDPLSQGSNAKRVDRIQAQENIVADFMNTAMIKDSAVKSKAEKALRGIMEFFFDENIPQSQKDRLYLLIMEQYLQTKQNYLHPPKQRAKKQKP